jgi:transcriptional activator for dhaKLM operon
LLYGESGVGKTTLAQAIHGASPRSKKPLIVVNCSAIPRDMILSELLGIEAHGGENGRPSKFELADGGTILIDQIDQLSLEGQAVLQDVIDTRHLMRLNSKRATPVNVRVIATTDVDVEAFVEAGGFARQLYFRFSVFKLYLPPLRNRKEDIEILVERFLRRPQEQYQMDEESLELLERYPWPGNVRELESVIERAILHSRDNVVRPLDLPENVRTIRALEPQRTTTSAVLTILEAEREAIVRAGWACQGVISAMADALGINRSTLWRKMNQYGINADDFK